MGATRQLPVTVEASGVRVCTITAHSEGDAIEPIHRRVTLNPSGGRLQVVLELIARPATVGSYWVTLDAKCDDGLAQTAGFSLEITR
jgi:hypothetical protein